jgi:cytoplasmic iron level regulating protein YaaA (DUF328/UPF0246 family)
MLLVISPAKSLNFAPAKANVAMTSPRLREETAQLAKVTARLRIKDLKGLMSISDDLARLNRDRFAAFDAEGEDGVQAAFAFNGDVYLGLRAREFDKPALNWAQARLRILSGMYGLLRPLDAIQPYRLEMGVRLKTRRGASLYDFWGARIAEQLNADAEAISAPALINLASQEYFGAVDREALNVPVVTCHFLEEKDGEARMLSFYAKRARGLMARYAVDHRIDRPEGLKGFDIDGYRFAKTQSSEADWVFSRPQPPPIAQVRAAERLRG